MALGTKAALSKMAIRMGTEAGDGTAVIERASKATGLLKKHMSADLFGNGGAVPAEGSANFFKGSRVIKQGFNSKTFFKG